MASRDTRPDDVAANTFRPGDTRIVDRRIEETLASDRADDGRIVEQDGTLVEPDRRQMPPPAEAEPGPQILTADTVRSGPLGRPVLVVLVASLATAGAVLGLMWLLAPAGG